MIEADLPAVQPGALLEGVEQLDALANERDLLGVVELQPERAGRCRCGERAQCRPPFEHDDLEAGPRREKGGRAADDAAADDHQVGRRRWPIGEIDGE